MIFKIISMNWDSIPIDEQCKKLKISRSKYYRIRGDNEYIKIKTIIDDEKIKDFKSIFVIAQSIATKYLCSIIKNKNSVSKKMTAAIALLKSAHMDFEI